MTFDPTCPDCNPDDPRVSGNAPLCEECRGFADDQFDAWQRANHDADGNLIEPDPNRVVRGTGWGR